MLTLTIEGVVGGTLLFAWLGKRRQELAVGVAILVAGSCLTHPFAWRANTVWLRPMPFGTRAAIIELSVVALEAAILSYASGWRSPDDRIGWSQALLLSLLMNGASFGYGLLRA